MKITIGGATIEDIQLSDAVSLINMFNKEKSSKTKINYGRGLANVWTQEERNLMEEKIKGNFSAKEVLNLKLFPGRSNAAIVTQFYQQRRKLFRSKNNKVLFTTTPIIN